MPWLMRMMRAAGILAPNCAAEFVIVRVGNLSLPIVDDRSLRDRLSATAPLSFTANLPRSTSVSEVLSAVDDRRLDCRVVRSLFMSSSGLEMGSGKSTSLFAGWYGLPRNVIAIDLFERLFVLGLFLHFLNNMLGKAAGTVNVVTGLIVLSELLPLVLIWSRGPSSTMSMKPSDWALGFAGASAPLLAISAQTAPLAPIGVCAIIMLIGLTIQVTAKFFLGRSFGVVAANRGVKVGGPYRIVRHPIYAGYTLTHIGFFLAHPCWQNFLVYSIGLGLQIMRIIREERVLGEDPSYREFAAGVRYRLLPGVF